MFTVTVPAASAVVYGRHDTWEVGARPAPRRGDRSKLSTSPARRLARLCVAAVIHGSDAATKLLRNARAVDADVQIAGVAGCHFGSAA